MPTVAQSRRTVPERGKPSKPAHAGRPRGNVTINRLTQLIRQVSEICKSEDEIAKYWPGDPNAVNSLEKPKNVAPITETISNASASFHRTFPPYSLTVLRMQVR